MLSSLTQAQRCVLPPEKQQNRPLRSAYLRAVDCSRRECFRSSVCHHSYGRLYLVADVLGIPLVHYVEERGEVVILRLVTVHAVIDCNKAYLLLWEQNLGIKADLKIVSAETAHILDDNCADFSSFGFCKLCLKCPV